MLTYALDRRGELSLYEYLYRCIRFDIESGVIAAHDKLPSKRALAKHLGVSLITVEGAYTQLIAEGYLYSVERKGYFAHPLSVGAAASAHPGTHVPHERPRIATMAEESGCVPKGEAAHGVPPVADLTGSSVAPGLFPYNAWAKTVRDVLTCESEKSLIGESSATGSLRLRETLASHLRGFRGIDADPAQIVIGAGAQLLYTFIIQLLGRDRRYAVEDPGYPRLTSIYRANDVDLAHVPIDASGISVDLLRTSNADVAHIMPSHQFPTGIVTSISRRYELLAWASEHPARYIVEDDYDCEFRLAGKPIPPLQSIDASERVIYVNTFAKSLGPAFRIGYMVLPPHLAERYAEQLGFYSCTVSSIDQFALARFIERGEYERHVNRMRSHYRAIRNELIDALKQSSIGNRVAIESEDSGLHFIVGVEAEATEKDIAKAVFDQGVRLLPLSEFHQDEARLNDDAESPQLRRFVISYSGITHDTIAPAVRAIEMAIDEGA